VDSKEEITAYIPNNVNTCTQQELSMPKEKKERNFTLLYRNTWPGLVSPFFIPGCSILL
jgi:hypothetical protein